jgi:hypothetical protein
VRLRASLFTRSRRSIGKLLLDDGARETYANDYGGIVHKRPLAVLLPGSVDDIVQMVRLARRHRLRIAARGQGHQPFGQAQVESGIVIDMRLLEAIHSVSSDRIEVDAGADWRAVVHASLSRGASPPVLTNYLGLTVGGTLSVGGIGVTTFRHGAQVDQVLELEVVTGDGKVQTCSKQDRSFRVRGRPTTVRVRGRFRSDDTAACETAAVHGLGIGIAPFWQIRPLVNEGLIQIILDEFESTKLPIFAVSPPTRMPLVKTRLFTDLLQANLKRARL